MSFWGEPISVYTRAQAIEDGVLVGIDEDVRNYMGIPWPIAFTAGAWAALGVATTIPTREELAVVDAALELARVESVRPWNAHPMGPRRPFTVATAAGPVELHVHIGLGDDGETVLTVMLPGED